MSNVGHRTLWLRVADLSKDERKLFHHYRPSTKVQVFFWERFDPSQAPGTATFRSSVKGTAFRSEGVLWRFVPRPMTLEQSIEFEDIDFTFACLLVDRMLERGHPQAERFATLLHRNRKEAA